MTNEEAACLLDPETNYSALVQYEAGPERMDAVEEALRIAAAVLREPKMVPLTLEQLRGMGGRPVWIVEHPDWGHWELSEDGEDYIADRDPELYGLRHDDPEGKFGLHKLGWIAYAYPPAHIDREAWEPCGETCRNTCMTCGHNADELFGDADYCKDCHRYSKWESTGHKYCERCGRPKTPGAWDELEKRLRG